jgi:histidinol-phosphate aminotransferase
MKVDSDVSKFVRTNILNLAPYIAGKPDYSQLRLHANEASWEPESAQPLKLNRYAGLDLNVTSLIANQYQINDDEFIVSRGSSEGVDIIIKTFCEPHKDAICISTPTFDMYRFYANIQDIDIHDVPLSMEISLNTYQFNYDLLCEHLVRHTNIKVLFLCSPNNPTGNSISENEIIGLCYLMKDQGIVVVDEAYIEFSTNKSVCKKINEINNLIILRTMSKSFALAGARVGYIISNNKCIAYMNRVVPPYSCPTPTQNYIKEALTHSNIITGQAYIKDVINEKILLYSNLSKHSFIDNVWKSDGNFILKKILVRGFPNMPILKHSLRITIGSLKDNAKLITALNEFRGN